MFWKFFVFSIFFFLPYINGQLRSLHDMEQKGEYFNWNKVTEAEMSHMLFEDEIHPEYDEDFPELAQQNWLNNLGGSRGDMGWAIIEDEYLKDTSIDKIAQSWEVILKSNAIDVKCFGIEGNKIMFVAEHDKKDMIRVKDFVESRIDVKEFEWSGNRPGYVNPDTIPLPPEMGGKPPKGKNKNKAKKDKKGKTDKKKKKKKKSSNQNEEPKSEL